MNLTMIVIDRRKKKITKSEKKDMKEMIVYEKMQDIH